MDRPDSGMGALPVSLNETTEAATIKPSPNEITTSAVLLSKVADLETRILSLEKKYRDERRARITLETKFRLVKAKSKQWAGATGLRLRMLEATRKTHFKILDTQREDRRISKIKREDMNSVIKILRNRVTELETAINDDKTKAHAAVGAKPKAKQIKTIIKEQGKHYRMIQEVRFRDCNNAISHD